MSLRCRRCGLLITRPGDGRCPRCNAALLAPGSCQGGCLGCLMHPLGRGRQ